MHAAEPPLRLITADQVNISGDDVVFRHSSRQSRIILVALVAGMAAIFVAWRRDLMPDVVAILAGATMLLLALPSRFIYSRALTSDNWVLACGQRTLLVKVRSYLNPGFPSDVPHVIELEWDEVAAARPAEVDVRGQDASREVQRHTLHFLDLEVTADVDLAEVKAMLERERSLRAKGQAWRHYPVSVLDDHVIRVEWRTPGGSAVEPSLDEAIALLRGRTSVQRGTRGLIDLGGIGRTLDPEAARRQVRVLAEQGNVIDATLLAKRAFGWSTTDARQYVESLAPGGDT